MQGVLSCAAGLSDMVFRVLADKVLKDVFMRYLTTIGRRMTWLSTLMAILPGEPCLKGGSGGSQRDRTIHPSLHDGSCLSVAQSRGR